MLIWNQQEPPPPVAYEISYGEVDVRLDPHFNEACKEMGVYTMVDDSEQEFFRSKKSI